MSDIVVVARVSYGANEGLRITNVERFSPEQWQQEQTLEREDETQAQQSIVIEVILIDDNKMARAIHTAERLLTAIVELNNRLELTTASWNVLYYPFRALDTWQDNNAQKRIVVDSPQNNRGIASARRGEPHTVYYAGIIGEPGDAVFAKNYYDNPNLAGGKGIIAFLLHELFHQSVIGLVLEGQSRDEWRKEVGPSIDDHQFFFSSNHSNLEALANEFMYNAASALSYSEINRHTFPPPGDFDNPISPQDLYSLRNPS